MIDIVYQRARMTRWRDTVVDDDTAISGAIKNLNQTGLGIVLCVSKQGRLMGVITDGDLRRGLLNGAQMDSLVGEIMQTEPVTIHETISEVVAQEIMAEQNLAQLPVVDKDGKLKGLHFFNRMQSRVVLSNRFVIMAGGKGKRLMPFTKEIPKPMVPVSGKPMAQHIIERARSQGFKHFVFCVNHLSEIIGDYFEDGKSLGVEISYALEELELGTAGGLSLISPIPEEPFIVSNGDVLSEVDYFNLIQFFEQNEAAALVAIKKHEMKNPFGVVEVDGAEVTELVEKPVSSSFVNAGVYVIHPDVLHLLPKNRYCDMPRFLQLLISRNKRVVACPIYEFWLDVGTPNDLEDAHVWANS